jgi:hypothetical protein
MPDLGLHRRARQARPTAEENPLDYLGCHGPKTPDPVVSPRPAPDAHKKIQKEQMPPDNPWTDIHGSHFASWPAMQASNYSLGLSESEFPVGCQYPWQIWCGRIGPDAGPLEPGT